MFDLFKLLEKKKELQVSLAGCNDLNLDEYSYNFSCGCDSSCDGGCKGDCSGECLDSSRGHSWD